jgi:hypothetical protein
MQASVTEKTTLREKTAVQAPFNPGLIPAVSWLVVILLTTYEAR